MVQVCQRAATEEPDMKEVAMSVYLPVMHYEKEHTQK